MKQHLMVFPWIVFYALLGGGGILTLMLFTGHGYPYSILGILLLVLAWTEYSAGKKNIAAKPPHKGIPTYWGERQTVKKIVDGNEIQVAVVLTEGDYLTMPYWPFYIDFIPVKVEKVNVDDVSIRDIICKASGDNGADPVAGGRISAFFSYTFVPDPERYMSFINSGGENEVKAIIENRISEVVRQEGRNYDWEAFQFSGDRLTTIIITKLCGEKPFVLEQDASGKWVPKKNGEVYVTRDPRDPQCTDQEITYFLEKVRQEMINGDGYADVQDLGVTLRRANLERFELGDNLKKAAEKLAEEQQQRRGEVFETQTELQQAGLIHAAYAAAGTPKTLEDCLLEIRRRKAQKEDPNSVRTFEVPGLAEGIKAVAEIAAAIRGNK